MGLVQRVQLRKFLLANGYRVSLNQFNIIYNDIKNEYEEYTTSVYAGPIQDFLQWILDNKDAIIELIKTIIDLFS